MNELYAGGHGYPGENMPEKSAVSADTPNVIAFQIRVRPWMDACFGPAISADTVERNHRFLEEALELVQACGCTREDCLQLVEYVYGRPTGEPTQEVGGVMVTLAALCLANALDMHKAAELELARVWRKIEVIRAKQAAKPRGSALPSSPSYQSDPGPSQTSGQIEELVEAVKPFAKAYESWSGGNAREHFASSVVPAHFARAAKAFAKAKAGAA